MKIINEKQQAELEMLLEIDRICRKNQIRYYLAYGSVLGAVRHNGFIPWDNDIDIMVEINNMDKLLKALDEELPEEYFLFSTHKDENYDSLKPRVGLANERHHKIHVDIFPMVGISSNKFIRNFLPKITSKLYLIYFLKKFDANSVHKHNVSKRIKHLIVKILLSLISSKFVKYIINNLSWKYPISDSKYIFNICSPDGPKEVIPKEYLSEPVYLEFEGHLLPVPKEWDKYLKHLYGNYMVPIKY